MAEVIVPPLSGQDWADDPERQWFKSASTLMRLARAWYPEHPEMGVSLVMSGITRELRRHYPIAEVQDMLRQFADTMPEVAKGDVD